MTFRARPALTIGVCGLLVACGGAPHPALPDATPARPLASEPMDGVYRGTSTRFQADSRACPSPGLVVLRVVGGSFEYRYGHAEIDATVTADGVVQGALGATTLTGKLENGRMEGDISGESCGYHFRAMKRAR